VPILAVWFFCMGATCGRRAPCCASRARCSRPRWWWRGS
jgi:hypothetical protein